MQANKYVTENETLFILIMNLGRIDRSAFKAQTAEDAADQVVYYQDMTWQERLAVANYLNSIAFNYPEKEPPKMDKTFFSVRGRE